MSTSAGENRPESPPTPTIKTEEDDPFAYINNGFTSEKFKIEIRCLPKYWGIGQLRKYLNNKLKLNCNKVKPPGLKGNWAYACFRNEEERNHAIEAINGVKWKGSILEAKVANPAPDPFVKRKLEEAQSEPNKRVKIDSEEEQAELIEKNVSPLCHMPYSDQLALKFNEAKSIIGRLGVEIAKANPNLSSWVKEQKEKNDGLVCPLLDIQSLEEFTEKYRNKCEFSIGKNELTQKRAIGFRLGTYASGSLGVAPVDHIKFVPDIMLKTTKMFEKYVQSSPYEVYSPQTLSGHWKQLSVRVGTQTQQLMAIVGFHPQDLTNDELSSLKKSLVQFFTEGEGAELNVNSLYFEIIKRKIPRKVCSEASLKLQASLVVLVIQSLTDRASINVCLSWPCLSSFNIHRDKGSDLPPLELLHGQEFIEEQMCGLTFKISPESFFQINSRCAELLIQSVKTLSNLNRENTVIDVCCGTGTIGLCLAKDCKKVLGVEVVPQAVSDAQENAAKNGITNCEFFCGKADEILTSVVNRVKSEDLIGVVDPPRAGLQPKAVLMLRKTENLKKIVFLSCDPNSAFKNFKDLCRAPSKTLLGVPFVPVAAVPVDMFPHTNHFEFIVYFERLKSEGADS